MSYGWEKAVISGATNASTVYTFDIENDTHISGTPVVTVSAAADRASGILSAMLVDIADAPFAAVMLEPYTEGVPTTEVTDKDGNPAVTFATTDTDAKIITRGWMDIRNRESVETASEVAPGEFYTYTLTLQPEDYTVQAGHKLALVLYSADVEVTYWPAAVTNYTIDGSGTSVELPVR